MACYDIVGVERLDAVRERMRDLIGSLENSGDTGPVLLVAHGDVAGTIISHYSGEN